MDTTTAPRRTAPDRGLQPGHLVGAGINAVLLYLLTERPGWDAVPFLTAEFERALGWVTASLLVSLAAELVYVVAGRPRVQALGGAITTAVGGVAAARLLQVWPFDLDRPWSGLAAVLLVLGVVGSAIGVVVNLVRAFRPW